jgi:NAD+ synthase
MTARTMRLISWIRDYFKTTGGETAIIGISGGKDSTICAALAVKALGGDHVIGVLMPNGEQKDISDSHRVCDFLKIKNYVVNINTAYSPLTKEISEAMETDVSKSSNVSSNLPARLRMCTLYSVAAMFPNPRVINTCNRSEEYLGYSTKYGDGAGDVSFLANLTVREVLEIGDDLGLPADLVHKAPSDGLCGKTDEDNFGFSYDELDSYLLEGKKPSPEKLDKIEYRHRTTLHKVQPMPTYSEK